jgi:hypothetical protein
MANAVLNLSDLNNDEKKEQVWVKRTIPAAWIFMKRRKTKDYIEVFQALIAAKDLGYVISPSTFMMDFEQATKKAIENLFPR